MRTHEQLAITMLVCGGAFGLAACQTAPETLSERETLNSETRATMSSFTSADSSLHDLLNKSVGYAVFPDVGKAGFIAGGAYGRGEVYEHGMMIGYADLTQGSVGLQAGAQTYDELIIFLTQSQMDQFKHNQFAFSGNVSAVAIKPGVAAAADHSKGVVVFVKPQGGLMAEASIGGQQFTYLPTNEAAVTRPSSNYRAQPTSSEATYRDTNHD